MRLLYNRVAVEEIQIEQKESLIALPESAKPKENRGVVVAIGSGSYTQTGDKIPMTVKVGDTVLFERTQVIEQLLGTKKVLIMGEASIIAILD